MLDENDIEILDTIKRDIADDRAKGKISEQHYKLLDEKIYDDKNKYHQQPGNKAASTSTTQGSPIKSL